jgi:hypothetical protein
MRFSVRWHRHAESELAEIWLNAQDRKAITNAALKIDAMLADSPLHAGESRMAFEVRIVFSPPLVIEFEVHEADLLVTITHVRALMR